MHYKLFSTAIYYLWRPYTIYGYILLPTAIYYFQRLYITFDGYILLLALPDCDFVRIQDFITFSRTYRLKARLDSSINLLTLIQFCFFCSSMVSSKNSKYTSKNSVLLEILRCWKCEILSTLRYKWFAMHTSKPTIHIN